MSAVVEALGRVRAKITEAEREANRPSGSARLVAVSKTFPVDAILPVLEAGQVDFGENRVQEAHAKWPALKERFPAARLHIIGPLQTNKVREAM
ncbi:MAG: YggS family pyridoxal phosphate-dependent enzyme, partial [Hyphomicrobiaceae bacterium]|nr:YggS family pyridoxal phosphate-dependent enzyme [Hyphomicrobiaceae bacterium]